MSKNPSTGEKKVHFYFSKSKGTHEEGGEYFITLFARLSLEVFSSENPVGTGKSKTFWVDIQEVKYDAASVKMKKMPDSVERFKISGKLFWELYKISQKCPEELYYITPLSNPHEHDSQ